MQSELLAAQHGHVYDLAMGDQSPTSGILAESGRFRASDPGRFDEGIAIIARRESKAGQASTNRKQ